MEDENSEILLDFLSDRLNEITPDTKFNTNSLISYLKLSISEFNSMPPFTNFTLKDEDFCNVMSAIIIRLAFSLALTSQSLLENSEFLAKTANSEYEKWVDQVNFIKGSPEYPAFWIANEE